MIKYIDSNTIDFIEYREAKKGIDLNLYLEMNTLSFLNIYEKTAMELDTKFNKLIDLDKKISALKRKGKLTKIDTVLYEKYVKLGQSCYERYSFLEDKLEVLNRALEEKEITLFNNQDVDYFSNEPLLDEDLYFTLNKNSDDTT